MAHSGDKLVHPVEITEQCRLAATRGPDECGHLAGRNLQIDAVQRLLLAVEELEILNLDKVDLS